MKSCLLDQNIFMAKPLVFTISSVLVVPKSNVFIYFRRDGEIQKMSPIALVTDDGKITVILSLAISISRASFAPIYEHKGR